MLESVVFAHQEESLWPLGEAQGLKKRFDDLFAATKYAKALDALRKLRVESAAAHKLGRARAGRLQEVAKAAARERGAVAGAEAKIAKIARDTAQYAESMERAHGRLRDAREAVARLERAEAAAAAAQGEAARAAGDAEAKRAALRSRYDLDAASVDADAARARAREAEEAASDAHRASAAASREAASARQRAAAQREQLASDERRLARLDAEAQSARRSAAARDAAAREAEAELASRGAELLAALQQSQTQQQTQQTQQQMLSSNPLAAVLASLPAEAVAALTRPLRPPLPKAPAPAQQQQLLSPTPGDENAPSSSSSSFVIPEADIERLLAALRARADACALAVEAARGLAAAADAASAAEADAAAAASAATREGARSKRDAAADADARAAELQEQASRLTGTSSTALKAAEQQVAALQAAATSAEQALAGSSAASAADDAALRGKEASERAAALRAERARATKNADRAARARLMEAAAGEAVEKLFALLHSRAARKRLALLFGSGESGVGAAATATTAASSDFSSWPPPGKMRPRADAAVARARSAEENAARSARSAAEGAAAEAAHLAAARSAAESTSADARGALRQLSGLLARALAAMGPELSRDVGLDQEMVDELREAVAAYSDAAADAAAEAEAEAAAKVAAGAAAVAAAAAAVTVVPSLSGFPGGNAAGVVGPTHPSSLAFPSQSLLRPQPPTFPDVPAILAEALRVLDLEQGRAAKLAVFAAQANAIAKRAREGKGCQTCGQELSPEAAAELAERQDEIFGGVEVKREEKRGRFFFSSRKEEVRKGEKKLAFFSIFIHSTKNTKNTKNTKQQQAKKVMLVSTCERLKAGTELLRTAVLLKERCEASGAGSSPSSSISAASAAASAASEAAARAQRELEEASSRRAALEEAAHEGAWKVDAAAGEWLSAKFAAESDAGGAAAVASSTSSTSTFSLDAVAEGGLLPVSFFLSARNFDEFSSALEEKEKEERKLLTTTTTTTMQQQQGGGVEGNTTTAAANPSRRLQEVEADLDAAERDRDAAADAARAASRALEQLRADLSSAQADLARARDALAQKLALAAERRRLEDAARDAEARAEALRAGADAARPAEASAERALAAASARREQVRAAWRSAEEGAAALSAAARALCDRVSLLAKSASEAGVAAISTTNAAAAGAPTTSTSTTTTNLERDRVVAALASGRSALSKAEEDACAAEARSAAVEKSMAHRDLKKRELEDVLSAKEAEVRAAKLQRDAEEAERLAAEAAGPDRGQSLKRRVREAEDRIRTTQSSIDVAQGAQQAAEQQRKHALAEIAKAGDAWRDPDTTYRSAFDDSCLLGIAASDVGRYHAALEKAILRFHAAKMEEINKAIKELWQKTYKGSDIESIALRADAGDGVDLGGGSNFVGASSSSSTAASASAAAVAATTGTSVGGKAARSYNYRLVMTTGGAELEMRGRCSAGQKVLASIIVRLALAEVLAISCGILALDEPTTNLDEANAAALADSLHELVRDARERKTNLQLIVITHDERFARRLGEEYCPFMWRVEKDDRQCSSIRRVVTREGFGNE